MPITTGYKALVASAMAEVVTYTVAEVQARLDTDARLQLVDIRDIRELDASGTAVGALHAPPYHKPVFADESKEYVLYCGAGWRSALAAKALQDMGMTNVAHIDGGYTDWVKAGAPVITMDALKAQRAAAKAKG
jgi:rhodanese-related sulfurtransferase